MHLVGGAAGPLGGDDLTVDIVVGPGAALRIRTVAASIALPDRAGSPSHTVVRASVASGGRLDWLPEPLIAAARCRHETLARIALSTGAFLRWRDELVCGRHGEEPGDASVTTVVRYAGRPLLHHQVGVGPSFPGWAGAAVLAGARATGTLVVVDPSWADGGLAAPAVRGDRAARAPLAGPAVLATSVAPAAGHGPRGPHGARPVGRAPPRAYPVSGESKSRLSITDLVRRYGRRHALTSPRSPRRHVPGAAGPGPDTSCRTSRQRAPRFRRPSSRRATSPTLSPRSTGRMSSSR
ncbi:urease accessory protein UreD [Luedemannella flava]